MFFNVSTLLSVQKIRRGGSAKRGYSWVIIESGSMKPAIFVGDLLFIKSSDSYQPGDIVTFVSDHGVLVTHRIISASKAGYITKGDANNLADNEIKAEHILGKVTLILPGAGELIRWLISPVSIIFVVCIFVLLWLIKRIGAG